jgi:hypothetical protein
MLGALVLGALIPTDDHGDLLESAVLVEGRLNDLVANPAWSLRPYGRIGAGARTYDYRDLDAVDAQANFVGHGALGLDLARETGRIGLRLEARDNSASFAGLRGELTGSETRNDVQLTAGLTIRL